MLLRELLRHIDSVEFINVYDNAGYCVNTFRFFDDDISSILDNFVYYWKVYVDALGCLSLEVSFVVRG